MGGVEQALTAFGADLLSATHTPNTNRPWIGRLTQNRSPGIFRVMRLIDLTRTIDPDDRARMPEPARPFAAVLSPEMEYLAPDAGGLEEMCGHLGCTPADLPDGTGWGSEWVSGMSSHMGTHVDAPLHYGPLCEGRPARTITDIALDELYCPGIVLDVRADAQANEALSVEALDRAIAAVGPPITEGSAVLLRTGQERFTLSDAGFYAYPGMSREGTLHLASLGAKVLGTDAGGWDRPFGAMREAFARTGDSSHLWDGHFAGREREVFIVQQLENLAALPDAGFHVGLFPMKLARASGAPARVVAFVDDQKP